MNGIGREEFSKAWHDGPPSAFPHTLIVSKTDDELFLAPGLSKREWFAGMALQGLLGLHGQGVPGDYTTAELAVRVADELIARLKS